MRRVFLVAVVALSACSIPIKQQVSTSHQVAHAALVAVDDAERALCQPAVSAPNTCSSPLAATVGLTNAKHQALSRLLSTAFVDDAKAGVAIMAWRAGDPTPTDVTTLLADVQGVLTTASTVTDSGLVSKAQTLVARVQAAVAAFGVTP